MIAKINVTLKTGVLDPQGNALKHSLEVTGYKEVEEVRIGKFIECYSKMIMSGFTKVEMS